MSFDRYLLTFNPNNHGHYYDSKRLLGVTTVLNIISKGDGLLQWAVNQAVQYVMDNLKGELTEEDVTIILLGAKRQWKVKKEEAANIGTQAHAWVEEYLKGNNPEWPEHPKVRNSCEAAVKWIDTHHWKTHAIEKQVYLPELGVAGICDWWAEVEGVLCVPDWKTSKSLHTSYHYQTAAYATAIELETGVETRTRWLLRIDKETGEFEERKLPPETLEADYLTFKNAVQIHRREQELNKQYGS